MMESIREHTRVHKHEVIPADNPMNQMVGYMCPTCEIFWHVGLVRIRALGSSAHWATIYRRVTSGSNARSTLTDYLNYRGVYAPVGNVVNRYRRPWVI
jgi:hypothetical protein